MNLPNPSQVAAFGRHIVSYAAGGVTVLAATHIVSGDQAATLTNSVSQISQGVELIAAGLAPVVSIVAGFYAAWSASHKAQVAAVKAAVDSGAIKGVTIAGAPK